MKFAIGLLAAAAFAQDAMTTLADARDKVLANASNLPKYVCVETIDRSYYARKVDPEAPPSCEKIALDRKRGRDSLQLEKTDRLRIAVRLVDGREIYSWTGAAPYAHGVEDILNGGPIATGAFAAHLLTIFNNASVRFRLLTEPSDTIDYGFRMPVEASRFLMMGAGNWLSTGYTGSLRIDRDSLNLRRIELETDELPPETGMCEENTVLEYRGAEVLPAASRTRLVMRDASQSERLTTISGCREASDTAPPTVLQGRPEPPGLSVVLEFDQEIDTSTAAAGDEISATVAQPITRAGSKVIGRIVQLIHAGTQFFIGIAFDTIEERGVRSPFYAHLVHPTPARETVSEGTRLTGHGLLNWPHSVLSFKASKNQQSFVAPAGFQSVWVTVDPSDR